MVKIVPAEKAKNYGNLATSLFYVIQVIYYLFYWYCNFTFCICNLNEFVFYKLEINACFELTLQNCLVRNLNNENSFILVSPEGLSWLGVGAGKFKIWDAADFWKIHFMWIWYEFKVLVLRF